MFKTDSASNKAIHFCGMKYIFTWDRYISLHYKINTILSKSLVILKDKFLILHEPWSSELAIWNFQVYHQVDCFS